MDDGRLDRRVPVCLGLPIVNAVPGPVGNPVSKVVIGHELQQFLGAGLVGSFPQSHQSVVRDGVVLKGRFGWRVERGDDRHRSLHG